MTLDSIVDLAYNHFIAQKFTGDKIRELIKRHAIEELDLSEEQAEARAWKEEPDIEDEIDGGTFRDFYLWYYFNVIAPLTDAALKNAYATLGVHERRHQITLYAIFRVTAAVSELPADEAIREWESNCNYELAGSDQLAVISTEFMGAVLDRPVF